ncbi:MAG: GMP synthase [Saprospiraceae bacterium]|nr:GMP synthase [Saprospiraceae bacterium]
MSIPRIAILDLNNGVPNQGLRCIEQIVQQFIDEESGVYKVFEIRQKVEIPDLDDFDIFISSGGPGRPLPEGHEWEGPFFSLLDQILDHNKRGAERKFLFLICHSFQLACHHWRLGLVNERKSYSFGIMPVHRTQAGSEEALFKGLDDPFHAVDSRAFQVVQPDPVRFDSFGARILAIEKYRPHIKLERSIMAIRFSDEIFGTQFHPEADADGMLAHFQTMDKKEHIITVFGEQKYFEIMDFLDDPEKIALTERIVLPGFLQSAAHKLVHAVV